MAYLVQIEKRAKKELDKIPLIYRRKIQKTIDSLAQDPFQGKKLEAELKGKYSIRAWPYRIIYEIHKKELYVSVVQIGHRQGVYE